MGAVNGFLLFLLVWTFTAFFEADDSLNIICEDMTVHVGDEFNLTCRVSNESNACCMKMYKFTNKYKHTEICREKFRSDPCIHWTIFSCPYTANEVMKTTIMFFSQTTCGAKSAEFTVNIAGAVTEDDKGGPNRKGDPMNETPVQTGKTTSPTLVDARGTVIHVCLPFT